MFLRHNNSLKWLIFTSIPRIFCWDSRPGKNLIDDIQHEPALAGALKLIIHLRDLHCEISEEKYSKKFEDLLDKDNAGSLTITSLLLKFQHCKQF